jgi:hypothetical protein
MLAVGFGWAGSRSSISHEAARSTNSTTTEVTVHLEGRAHVPTLSVLPDVQEWVV